MKISTLKETPQIVFSLRAYFKMKTLIEKTSTECAWHGCVTREGNKYTIEDIEVYPQYVAAATVDAIDGEYTQWMLQHTDDEISTIRFQGHSHVNMSVSPSGTDISFYEELVSQVRDYYIFLIQNKKGEYYLRFVDKESGLIYEDMEYKVDYGMDDWYEEQAVNMKKEPVKVPLVSSKSVTKTSGSTDMTGSKALDMLKAEFNDYYQYTISRLWTWFDIPTKNKINKLKDKIITAIDYAAETIADKDETQSRKDRAVDKVSTLMNKLIDIVEYEGGYRY